MLSGRGDSFMTPCGIARGGVLSAARGEEEDDQQAGSCSCHACTVSPN
jgi:hypothetical protein